MTQTLGFYTLADYKAELKRRGLGLGLDIVSPAVRCEALTQDKPSKDGAIAFRTYLVMLTAYAKNAGEVLTCAIHTGSGIAAFADKEPHAGNLIKAHALIVADLEQAGFTVLPGEYTHESTGRAICDLWRYDKERRLVSCVRDSGDPASIGAQDAG